MARADEIFVIRVNGFNYTPTVANSIPDQLAYTDVPFTFTFNDNTFTDKNSDQVLSYTA